MKDEHYHLSYQWTLLLKCVCVCACVLSHAQLFATHGLQPARLLCPCDFPVKNTGLGCHFLLQGIFPTQGLKLCLLSTSLPYITYDSCIGRQVLYR